jgi:pantoate--beta-alanine ligase
MKTIKDIKKMQAICSRLKTESKTIGFIPTMGYLHEGHLSLLSRAVKDCDVSVLSIYVNPAQFGPKEDFKKYPRDIEHDLKLCRKNKADYVFIPENEQVYPQGYSTYVQVDGLTDVLCGRSRPGHFKGVTTVVNKLFNIVMPDIAYFGQKDAQQALVIKKMVDDLHIPLKIKVLPIVREPDGLAMSSRNAYLNQAQRRDAGLLFKSLENAKMQILKGQTDAQKIISQIKGLLCQSEFVKIDYISIVDAKTLEQVKKINKRSKILIALAVYLGKVRLIDNMLVNIT